MKDFAKVIVLLVALLAAEKSPVTSATCTKTAATDGSNYNCFLDEHGDDILGLVKKRFDLSLKYLYTSSGYGDQTVQRPGMAKFLRSLSDTEWEKARNTLKKYFERGGSVNVANFKTKFQFKGKNELTEENKPDYLQTLKNILKESKETALTLNALHRMAGHRKEDNEEHKHDAEFAHFAEDELEEQVKKIRDVAGKVTSLGKMSDFGVALNVFDSNLN